MNHEPILDEIRRVRHEISREVEHDPRQFVAYYSQLQQSVIGRVVNLSGEVTADPGEAVRAAAESSP